MTETVVSSTHQPKIFKPRNYGVWRPKNPGVRGLKMSGLPGTRGSGNPGVESLVTICLHKSTNYSLYIVRQKKLAPNSFLQVFLPQCVAEQY